MEEAVIITCPVCRRYLALADRNGRHVASEAHYPHADACGTMVCSPPTLEELGRLTVDAGSASNSPGKAALKLASNRTISIGSR
jgi:hypothetical protein